MASGRVSEWHAEEGWGVIASMSTPNGCWAHFSSIDLPGYRELEVGEAVSFDFEPADQDGYVYRALLVRVSGRDRGLLGERPDA